jgi:hypothetical protein
MKKSILIIALGFSLIYLFNSCKKDEIEPNSPSILPENFSIEVPKLSAFSVWNKDFPYVVQGIHIDYSAADCISLSGFVAKLIDTTIAQIRKYNPTQKSSFTYQSKDDNRAKNIMIYENAEFEGKIWQYQMNVSDADSEENADGGLGFQLFWNQSPLEGIAILRPSNLNMGKLDIFSRATFRVDYSEASNNYEKEMTVYIKGFKFRSFDNRYIMESLKMTIGRKANITVAFGNANFPDAQLFNSETGYNIAVVAAGTNSPIVVASLGSSPLLIGTSEIGLPFSNLNSTDRKVILEDYSMKNVYINQLKQTHMTPDGVEMCLWGTSVPCYYEGIVMLTTISPGPEFDECETALKSLVPFNPSEVTNLQINFKLK